MKLKYPVKRTKARIFKAHGEEVSLDETTYIDVKTKCRFVDKIYGEWWATPNNVANGQSHPKKGMEKIGIAKRLPFEELKKRIMNVHGNIVSVDETSYVAVTKKARFIDKDFGEWFAKPDNVMRGTSHPAREKEKIKQTCLKKYGVESVLGAPSVREKYTKTMIERYGVEYPCQNKEFALKAAKSANQITVLEHWFSKENVNCRGTFEVAVVEYLNKNKIDYIFQPKTFTMPDNRKYTPDLYLIEQDFWIEIKGTFRTWDLTDDAEEKWNWFHKNYPNSELWKKEKLKELGLWKRVLELQKNNISK